MNGMAPGSPSMTSMQRVLAALAHQEPDRVPFFLFLTLHGARELGIPLREYLLRPDLMAEAQLRMQRRYGHDCLYSFTHASAELEAFGGETLYFDDGPPNGGAPIIHRPGDILGLEPPRIADCPALNRVLDLQTRLKAAIGDEVPIIGVVMAPFSLPVMQMGFEAYLELMAERPDLFRHLMAVNEAFCVAWANAQLQAGAKAICYFDPVGSSTVVTPDQYRRLNLALATRTLAQIQGPTATHFASGRALPVLDQVAATGTLAIGTSSHEDLGEVKRAAQGRLAVLGNWNGIEMCHWTSEQAEHHVKHSIASAGQGGGLILADNHGEIPWQVPETVLEAVSQAVYRWGPYPLQWLKEAENP